MATRLNPHNFCINNAKHFTNHQPNKIIDIGMATRLNPHNFCINNAKHFTNHQPNKIIDIGMGKYIWLGTFKSVRTGWKVQLNVDMANKPGYEREMVKSFISKYLNCPENQLQQKLSDR